MTKDEVEYTYYEKQGKRYLYHLDGEACLLPVAEVVVTAPGLRGKRNCITVGAMGDGPYEIEYWTEEDTDEVNHSLLHRN